MLTKRELVVQINLAKYLDLISIQICGISQLEVVVREAIANEGRRGQSFVGSDLPELAAIVKDAVPKNLREEAVQCARCPSSRFWNLRPQDEGVCPTAGSCRELSSVGAQ